MIENKVDLIIIEGMGRSLHTNLNSNFKCESLKLAVIKVTQWNKKSSLTVKLIHKLLSIQNKFLASRLGGNLFDAICKYENSLN